LSLPASLASTAAKILAVPSWATALAALAAGVLSWYAPELNRMNAFFSSATAAKSPLETAPESAAIRPP